MSLQISTVRTARYDIKTGRISQFEDQAPNAEWLLAGVPAGLRGASCCSLP